MKLLNLDAMKELFKGEEEYQSFVKHLKDTLDKQGIVPIFSGATFICWMISAEASKRFLTEGLVRELEKPDDPNKK